MNPAQPQLVDLLERTSRTFAVAIPCLDEPLRTDVTVAYLLFRVADIIEDGTELAQEEKLACLDRLHEGLRFPRSAEASLSLGLPRPPTGNPDYLELLANLDLVLRAFHQRDDTVQEIITASVRASIAGMQRFIAQSPDGMVQVSTVPDVRDYCYCVAGLVGEMLTALYVERFPTLVAYRDRLLDTARWFGEGLQLVNILKDAHDDEQDGRLFVASEALRTELFALARADLRLAEEYVQTLAAGHPPAGLLAFNRLPLRLAWRTLELVETKGPGSKVSRDEVFAIVAEVVADSQRTAHLP